MRTVFNFLLLCALLLLFTPLAWGKGGGDPCLKLTSNAEWNSGITELSALYKSKSFDDALKKADELSQICSRSPLLNYFRGRIYREKGDDTKALYYIQLATNSTEEFSVKGDLLERMWYERYEIEHVEARPEKIDARQKEIADLQQRTKTAEEKLSEKTVETRFTDYDTVKSYATGLWTGVAIGAVGLVLTGVGAGLFIWKKDDAIRFKYDINSEITTDDKKSDRGVVKVNEENYIYNGLLWSGVSLSIVGAIFAGFFGYKYAHISQSNDALSFNIFPTEASISIKF